MAVNFSMWVLRTEPSLSGREETTEPFLKPLEHFLIWGPKYTYNVTVLGFGEDVSSGSPVSFQWGMDSESKRYR